MMRVDFYNDGDEEAGALTLVFDDDIEYRLNDCYDDPYQKFQRETPPEDPDKIWTMSKSGGVFTVSCNGVDLLITNVAKWCTSVNKERWMREIKKVKFSIMQGREPKEFRIKPGKEIPVFIILGGVNIFVFYCFLFSNYI